MCIYGYEAKKAGGKTKSNFCQKLDRGKERVGYLWPANIKQKFMSGGILYPTVHDLHLTDTAFA